MDFGMSQSDMESIQSGLDPSGQTGGVDSTDNSEEYNSAIEDQTQKQAYTSMRGATATNPYPESFFSRMFGAENVDYTNILGGGQAGLNRVAEINDLRFRQAMGLPSLKTGKQYQAGDYYIGQDTNMGTVKAIPDMARDIMSFIPGGGIMSNFIPQKGLPENDPRYRAIMEEREKSANDPTVFDRTSDFVKSILGFDPKDSGASLATSPAGDGQFGVPDNRVFDAFGTTEAERADTREEEPIIDIKSLAELAEERKKLNEKLYGGSDNRTNFQNKPKYEQQADLSQTFKNMGDEMNQFIGADGKKIGEGNLKFYPSAEDNRFKLEYKLPVSNYLDRAFG